MEREQRILEGRSLRKSTPTARHWVASTTPARCAWDPDRAAVSNVSPASLTHGATDVTASGSDGAAYEADAAALLEAVSGGNASEPFFVLNRRVAILLASKRLTTGQRAFPKLG